MSLEQQVTALVEASNNLTSAVNGKIGDIDNKLNQKMAEVDQTLDNLFLDPRFGIQPSHEQLNPQDVPDASGSSTIVVPILTVDVMDVSAFNQSSFVVDIFASGAVASAHNWYRQLHVSFKQQHQTFTYNVKCTSQNGAGVGVVSVTYDPNGGQWGAGQLKVWVNSYVGYNTMAFVARGTVKRYNPEAPASSNDLGALHFRKEEGFLANSAQHDAVKALPNYTELDV